MGGEQAGGTPKFRTGCRLRRTLDTQVELSAGSGICESGDRMQVPQVTFMELIPRANAPEWGKKPARWAVSQTASGLGELGLFSTPAPIQRVWAPLTTRTGSWDIGCPSPWDSGRKCRRLWLRAPPCSLCGSAQALESLVFSVTCCLPPQM